MNRALLRWFDRIDPAVRRHAALLLLEVSVVAYPVTGVLVHLQLGEWRWFEQIMLLVSFGAIWATCIDVLCTTDVRVNEDAP